MRSRRALLLLPVALALACGEERGRSDPADGGTETGDASGSGEDGGDPHRADAGARDGGLHDGGASDAGPLPDAGGDAVVVDLRADVNRNGVVDLDDPTEDADEDTWSAAHGAIFLANIDDDRGACARQGSDLQLARCHDAADEVLNGADDAADLARLKTVPWPQAPASARGSLSLDAPAVSRTRLFVRRAGSDFTVFRPDSDVLSADDLRTGVELGLEGRDVLRDASVWDGYADVTLTVSADTLAPRSDTVRLRLAPMITRHHLDPPLRVYAVVFDWYRDSEDFIDGLVSALSAAGVAEPLSDLATDDQWAQDLFETAYMAMPAPGGLHVVHVNVRSANRNRDVPTASHPLREAGQVVFTRLRGKDVGAVQQFDPNKDPDMDTLDSFGNLETIPPYSHDGRSYPLGRIIRGRTASYFPDPSQERMWDAQAVQPPVYVDTSWLLVAHVDETVTFVKAPGPRGWTVAAADPALARTMLEQQRQQGRGNTLVFQGLQWLDEDMNEYPAQTTIGGILDDVDVMNASSTAAVEIDNQLAVIKAETGLTDAEILRLPVLFTSHQGRAVAYMVDTANGISLGDAHYGAPLPHGPVVGGRDLFRSQLEQEFARVSISVQWIENWNLYHRLDGEVHCGSNTTRKVRADERWWESAR